MKELQAWQEEQRSAHLYRVLAEMERGSPRERLFRELAREAAAQSEIWAEAASKAGHAVPVFYRPDLRTHIVEQLTRRLGPRHMRSMLAAMKVRGMSVYARVDPGHATPDATTGLERRHRGLSGGGNLRAAVFGVNDGLVSNASLILGVAGASGDAGGSCGGSIR